MNHQERHQSYRREDRKLLKTFNYGEDALAERKKARLLQHAREFPGDIMPAHIT
jgi:hypothetical protein